jgi:hypothetical protein
MPALRSSARLLFCVLTTLAFAVTLSAQTAASYGRQCASLIAEVEEFDCRKGPAVPITVNGKTPVKYTPNMTCDRPAMAADNPFPCAPYSRVQLLRDDTVQASSYCRQKSLRSAKSPYFDEIDVILHSRVNGATCWFSATAKTKKGIDGSRVPSPTKPSVKRFWDPPAQTVKGSCVSCHDSDPWMYSPFIGQTNQYPADPFGYYTNAIGPFKAWPEPKSITVRGNNCVSCHRIGNLETCKTTMLQATGRAPIKGADTWAKQYPHSHWMPVGNALTLRQWNVTYDDAMRELGNCCTHPEAAGCEVKAIGGKR